MPDRAGVQNNRVPRPGRLPGVQHRDVAGRHRQPKDAQARRDRQGQVDQSERGHGNPVPGVLFLMAIRVCVRVSAMVTAGVAVALVATEEIKQLLLND